MIFSFVLFFYFPCLFFPLLNRSNSACGSGPELKRLLTPETSSTKSLTTGGYCELIITQVEVEKACFSAGIFPEKLTEPTYFNSGDSK